MAWEKVKANRGSGGVDGQNLEVFEAQLNQQLERLQRELKEDTYQPLPVRLHRIPKRDKPGGVSTVGTYRRFMTACAQQALLNWFDPIFEPVFDESRFVYRRGRSTKNALIKVWKGDTKRVRVDRGCGSPRFFRVRGPLEKLLTLVAQRVADGRVVRLIKAIVKAGIYGKGLVFRSERGTPQGNGFGLPSAQ